MAIAMMDKLKESRVAPGFGGADQVPKRAYTLDELRLNKICELQNKHAHI